MPLSPAAHKFLSRVCAGSLTTEDFEELVKNDRSTIFCLDHTKRTALHVAASRSHLHIIQLLLEAGLDVNAADSHGLTPLLIACQKANLETVQLLIENGADPDKPDKHGRNVLDLINRNYGEDKKEIREYVQSRVSQTTISRNQIKKTNRSTERSKPRPSVSDPTTVTSNRYQRPSYAHFFEKNKTLAGSAQKADQKNESIDDLKSDHKEGMELFQSVAQRCLYEGSMVEGGKFLYCGYVGSRQFNVSHTTSDHDLFIVWAAPTAHILGLRDPDFSLHHSNSIKNPHPDDKPDFTIVELKKFCRLLLDGDPRHMESLWNEQNETVIYKSPEWKLLQARRDQFLSKLVLSKFKGHLSSELKHLNQLYKLFSDEKESLDSNLKQRFYKKQYLVTRITASVSKLLHKQCLSTWIETGSDLHSEIMLLREKEMSVLHSTSSEKDTVDQSTIDDPTYQSIVAKARDILRQVSNVIQCDTLSDDDAANESSPSYQWPDTAESSLEWLEEWMLRIRARNFMQ